MRQSASDGWAWGGQGGRTGGQACYPGRRISDPNLRPKWVRMDKLGPRCLLGRAAGLRFPHFPVRVDTFRSGVVVWVGPLKMPL
jgi:hypothetical protein